MTEQFHCLTSEHGFFVSRDGTYIVDLTSQRKAEERLFRHTSKINYSYWGVESMMGECGSKEEWKHLFQKTHVEKYSMLCLRNSWLGIWYGRTSIQASAGPTDDMLLGSGNFWCTLAQWKPSGYNVITTADHYTTMVDPPPVRLLCLTQICSRLTALLWYGYREHWFCVCSWNGKRFRLSYWGSNQKTNENATVVLTRPKYLPVVTRTTTMKWVYLHHLHRSINIKINRKEKITKLPGNFDNKCYRNICILFFFMRLHNKKHPLGEKISNKAKSVWKGWVMVYGWDNMQNSKALLWGERQMPVYSTKMPATAPLLCLKLLRLGIHLIPRMVHFGLLVL